MKNYPTNLSECNATVIGVHDEIRSTCKVYNISGNCTPHPQLPADVVASLYTKYDARPMQHKMNTHSGGKVQLGGAHVGLTSVPSQGSSLQNNSRIEPPNIAPKLGKITAEPIITKSFVSNIFFFHK